MGAPVVDPKYDLVADGVINGADLAQWLVAAAMENGQGSPYLPGDADISGNVDGVDFIAWNANKFQSGTVWSQGDFDGSGIVDGSDFIVWNQHKFQSSDTAAVVPEPTGLLLLGWSVGWIVASRWRLSKHYSELL